MKRTIIAIAVIGVLFNLIAFFFLPEKVPLHFNWKGEPDSFGSRLTFSFIYGGLYFFLLILYFAIPAIDPKRRVAIIQKGYSRLFLSLISAFLLFNFLHFLSARSADMKVGIINVGIGLLLFVVGNYLPTIKPNYFMGIRTPWTLENEVVWRKTHRLGGWLFALGGILICLSAFAPAKVRHIVLIAVLIIITLVPFLFSYFIWAKKEKPRLEK